MDREIVQKRRVKVKVCDPDTDAVLEERIVENDFVVVCVGNRFVKSWQMWGSTFQLNISREK